MNGYLRPPPLFLDPGKYHEKIELLSVIMTLRNVLLRKEFTKRFKMPAVSTAGAVHEVQLALCEIDPPNTS